MANVMRFGGGSCEKARYVADVNPASGVTYVNGLAGLDASVVSMIANAISDSPNITKTTDAIYFDLGPVHRKISVADQVTLTLNGTEYAFDVIGFNHDDLTSPADYGVVTRTSKAGITLQMHGKFATTYLMNSSKTNVGGWKDSVMRVATMPLMKSYLPSAWQNIIKPVNKTTGIGGGTSGETETVSDDCFLLSAVESRGSAFNTVPGEGDRYLYYSQDRSRLFKPGDPTPLWWQRSPNVDNNETFLVTRSFSSMLYGTANDSHGVSFAFCV